MKRRDFLKTAAAGAFMASGITITVKAQAAWPEKGKTIKVIVPWPPGAANDALGRLVSQRLQETMGATSIVENKVGGAGLIGTNEVINAAPDGYTFLASAFNTAVMPKVLKAATFNPEVDLEAVARTAVAPLVLVISAKRPEKTLRNSSNLRRRTRRISTSRSPRWARRAISRRSISCAAPASTSTSSPIVARFRRCRISSAEACSCS